jgi:predicted phosphodiesterase
MLHVGTPPSDHPHSSFHASQRASVNKNMSPTLRYAQNSPIKTRFLIISDTHSASPAQNIANNDAGFRPPLPKADVLLHCGDLTMAGHLHEYEKTLDMLEGIDADLKLVIAGNHDISLDEIYYGRKGQYMHRREGYEEDMPAKAKAMWLGDGAKRAGVTYLGEGTHTFILKNGAKLRVCLVCSLFHFHQADRARSTRPRTNQSSATGPSPTSGPKTDTTLPINAPQMPHPSPKIQFQTSPP